MAWRPTLYLGGKDEQGWKTARAKIYPWRLSKAIPESHLEHAKSIATEGDENIDDEVQKAIKALSEIFDPYDSANDKHVMQADYHRSRLRKPPI